MADAEQQHLPIEPGQGAERRAVAQRVVEAVPVVTSMPGPMAANDTCG